MMVDVVRNPQKSNVYAYEIKRVRCVGVYSGMMYGYVRYAFRVSASIFISFCFSTAADDDAAAVAVGGAASFCTYTKHLFHFPFDEIYRRLIFSLSGFLFPRD